MLMMKKILLLLIAVFSLVWWSQASESYVYFYGNSCAHCLKVEKYFEENSIEESYKISKYEVFENAENRQLLSSYLKKLNLSRSQVWTPFMVIESGGQLNSLMGDVDIIAYFSALQKWEKLDIDSYLTGATAQTAIDLDKEAVQNPVKFLWIMVPMAAADSINPCAFAVMLLLLSTIFSKSKSKKKTIAAGLLFSLAIFLSYLLIGMGFYKVLGYAEVTTAFKRIVGIVGLLIAGANIKDYFRYGEWFLMEVPMAWRPKMMKIIQSAVSPMGAFVIGILVSLFLLPCSSGPYFVVLGLLKSENVSIAGLGIWYLVLYNLIFILPMLIITLLVGTGQSSVEKIAKMKNKNTKLMHLIMGVMMLLLSIYVIGSMYFDWLNFNI